MAPSSLRESDTQAPPGPLWGRFLKTCEEMYPSRLHQQPDDTRTGKNDDAADESTDNSTSKARDHYFAGVAHKNDDTEADEPIALIDAASQPFAVSYSYLEVKQMATSLGKHLLSNAFFLRDQAGKGDHLDRMKNKKMHQRQTSAGSSCSKIITFGVLADEGVVVPVSQLAAAKINAVFVPLDPTYPVSRLITMLQDCALLVYDAKYEAVVENLLQAAEKMEQKAVITEKTETEPNRAAMERGTCEQLEDEAESRREQRKEERERGIGRANRGRSSTLSSFANIDWAKASPTISLRPAAERGHMVNIPGEKDEVELDLSRQRSSTSCVAKKTENSLLMQIWARHRDGDVPSDGRGSSGATRRMKSLGTSELLLEEDLLVCRNGLAEISRNVDGDRVLQDYLQERLNIDATEKILAEASDMITIGENDEAPIFSTPGTHGHPSWCSESDPLPLYQVYTSGSTGVPKAVVGTQFALDAYLFQGTWANEDERKSDVLYRKRGTTYHRGLQAPRGRGIESDQREVCVAENGKINETKTTRADVVLLCSAVTWDPSISDVFGTLLYGATLVLPARAELVSDLRGCIEKFGVTHVLATPALWKLLRRSSCSEKHEDHEMVCSSLRMLLLGGESWRKEDIFVPKNLRALHNIYGVTEATVYQAVSKNLLLLDGRDTASAQKKSQLLYPLRGNHTMFKAVKDAGTGELQLLIGGAQVLSYAAAQSEHAPKTTQAAWSAHGFFSEPKNQAAGLATSGASARGLLVPAEASVSKWFRSGDAVEVLSVSSAASDEHNHEVNMTTDAFRICGRLDRQVKLNGFRVELGEVEAVVSEIATCCICTVVQEEIFSSEMFTTGKNIDGATDTATASIANEKGGPEVKTPVLTQVSVSKQQDEAPASAPPLRTRTKKSLVAIVYEETRNTLRNPADQSAGKVGPLDKNYDAMTSSSPTSDFIIAVRAFCESKLPRHAVPARFLELRGALPMTTSGKIDRLRVLEAMKRRKEREVIEGHSSYDSKVDESDLEHLFTLVAPTTSLSAADAESDEAVLDSAQQQHDGERKNHLAGATPTSPGTTRPPRPVLIATPTEQKLQLLWSEVLHLKPAAITNKSHFFELGGTSANAVEMVRRLEEEKVAARGYENAEAMHRKLCGLIRKPRLREYAAYLDWTEQQTVLNTNKYITSSSNNEGFYVDNLKVENKYENYTTTTEEEVLYSSFQRGDILVAKILLQANVVDPNGGFDKKYRGRTPLLRLLAGSDGAGGINAINNDLAQQKLKESMQRELARLLLEAKADINLADGNGQTPVHLIAGSKAFDRREDRVERQTFFKRIVTDYNGILLAKDANHQSVLFYAVIGGNLNVLRYLLEEQTATVPTSTSYLSALSSTNKKAPSGRRASNETQMANTTTSKSNKLLSVTHLDRWGKSVLHYAVEKQNTAMVRLLLENPLLQSNFKPLQRAHRRRNDMLEYLPPVSVAVRDRNVEMLKLLMKTRRATPVVVDEQTETGDEVDQENPSNRSIDRLNLAKNRDDEGRTCLHEICRSALEQLDERTVGRSDSNGKQHINTAKFDAKAFEIFRLLVEYENFAPQFLDAVDKELRTVLFYLIPGNRNRSSGEEQQKEENPFVRKAADLLLKHQARVNMHDREGRNYLEYHEFVCSKLKADDHNFSGTSRTENQHRDNLVHEEYPLLSGDFSPASRVSCRTPEISSVVQPPTGAGTYGAARQQHKDDDDDSKMNTSVKKSQAEAHAPLLLQKKGRFQIDVDIQQADHKLKKLHSKKNQCFRCLEFGHSYRECLNEPKCRVCGENHETKDHHLHVKVVSLSDAEDSTAEPSSGRHGDEK
ncbi:unnamed protein product [Amoebophrya sp. A120]|nr:unnamed protein product [Amoebophrya sp. A120]|eukprot:GSA120T00014982001.1